MIRAVKSKGPQRLGDVLLSGLRNEERHVGLYKTGYEKLIVMG